MISVRTVFNFSPEKPLQIMTISAYLMHDDEKMYQMQRRKTTDRGIFP